MLNPTVHQSRAELLACLKEAEAVTFIRGYGNLGDELIYAGTRQLLREIDYEEVSLRNLQGVSGHTALLSGSGAWCRSYHDLPKYLPLLERRFQRVIVLPSSFDVTVPEVRESLHRTRATVFARERKSFEAIQAWCQAQLAHDTAFFFDFSPYRRRGSGVLHAYREDKERCGYPIPPGNIDLSLACNSLDEWLWTIARHALIKTDRAHVMIAAALLGKEVEFRPSNYHKVPALAEFGLQEFPVRLSDEPLTCQQPSRPTSTPAPQNWAGREQWLQRLRQTAAEIDATTQNFSKFVLIDEDQVRPYLGQQDHAVPFLERDGMYWGVPADDRNAIQELSWLREQGVEAVVLAWPAFWWLDHFQQFADHLSQSGRCLLQTDRIHLYQLSPPHSPGPSSATAKPGASQPQP